MLNGLELKVEGHAPDGLISDLRSHFSFGRDQIETTDRLGAITSLLFGTKRYRLGNKPNEDEGLSSALRMGRVYYKMTDSKTSNNTIPPWCGFGFIKETDGHYRLTTLGLRKFRDLGEYTPATLIISNGISSEEVRIDLLPKGFS